MVEYRGYKFDDYNPGSMRLSQYHKMIDLLEQYKPKRICEMGSGISTIIFEQYCQKYNAVSYSIEHQLGYRRAHTVMLPVWEFTDYTVEDKHFTNVNRYIGLTRWLRIQQPFDFVLCDGPYGCGFRERYTYGRIQLVAFPLIHAITDNGIIIMHDSNRTPQHNTLVELEKIFQEKNINYTKEEDKQIEIMTTYYLHGKKNEENEQSFEPVEQTNQNKEMVEQELPLFQE